MKFKDLKVGDVISYSKLRIGKDCSKLYYLVTKVYELQKLHKHNGKVITYKCFDYYSFYNSKIYTSETHIREFDKVKISHLFK